MRANSVMEPAAPRAAGKASARSKGIYAALASAFFLGLAPVFGRQAILLGWPAMAVVTIRTTLAALLLLAMMLIFFRRYFSIYPAGLLGCLMAGWINGFGSLFYYYALGRINANIGQLLYSLYPLFLALWLTLDNQPPSRLTALRLGLALPAIYLLVSANGEPVDLVGVGAMLAAALLYALHLPFNQRVLVDMPPPTVTLFTLLAMSSVVIPVFLLTGTGDLTSLLSTAPQSIGGLFMLGWPVLGLTLVTFSSRLALFTGVKHLGGMQTALLGLSELLVTLVFSFLWLGERLSARQWVGALLLIISMMLVGLEKPSQRPRRGGFLSWLRPAGMEADAWQPYD